jgi:spermidine synthase
MNLKMTPTPPQPHKLYAILFLSGFAGLGYEMVWTRMLAVGLGHEIVAVLAIVAAFFCGMALGAWALDAKVSRSPCPGYWYALLELAIGLWALALLGLVPAANRLAATLIGSAPCALRHWGIAFGLPFVLLLPATFAMGATLPAMERLFSRTRGNARSVGGLYAANTFGAVAGVMLTTMVIAPELGFRVSTALLAVANFVCAWAVLKGGMTGVSDGRPPDTSPEANVSPSRITARLFLTGFLGIGYEVLVVRVASQILENTIYSFAALLAVYLLGTASGAALYQRFAPHDRFKRVLTYLLQGAALLCLSGTLLLLRAESIFQWFRDLVGGGMHGAVMGEIGLAMTVFFLPTLAMGAIFSHLAQGSRHGKGGVGRALGINTLGASVAPLVCGVWLLPAMGTKYALMAVSLGYLAMIPKGRWSDWMPAAIPLGIALALGLLPTGFHNPSLDHTHRVAAHREGIMATVTVVADPNEDFFLKVNNKFLMGGTASRFSDGRQGHIPLLLHPHPRRALFLGLGTGATFAASAAYPDLAAEGVELIPEVIEVLPFFEKATGPLGNNHRLRLHVADARRFIGNTQNTYDVIVADLFHPARDGAGFLYTVEHFAAIRDHLTANGLFCQWLPLYQMDLELLRMIVRTFLHVFPEGNAILATYSLKTPIVGLIAGKRSLRYAPDYFNRRLNDQGLAEALGRFRLDRFYNLFGTFIAGPGDLSRFSGTGRLNTDDLPGVIFKAPRFAYVQGEREPAHVRLLELIGAFEPEPEQFLTMDNSPENQEISARLSAYWRARDRFLQAGVGIRPTEDMGKFISQVQAPLLAIVRESPDFEAAYNPLLVMARRLQVTHPEAADRLLMELEHANPGRREASQIRQRLRNRQ